MIDRTAEIGRTYRYTAERVRTVTVGGQTLELRGAPSATVTVDVRDVFPPEAPEGLVAVPGFTGEGRKPTLDLSWEPDLEPHIAGYRVYRRAAPDGSSWERLNGELVTAPAYRDLSVAAGQQYAYRVTAVSDAEVESGPGAEVVETAPQP